MSGTRRCSPRSSRCSSGLTIGKAWERYKLRDGKWIDRRRARESPHYILGLNFLVANQIDLAIEELSRAASLDADALEVHMILGNLYREKGQVGKAITVHQGLLQRPKLTQARARATCCSAWASTTSAAGSSIARSRRSTRCCGSTRRTSTRCVNLQKLHEEQHQWTEAYDTRQRLSKLADVDTQPQNQAILAFLENEIGLEAMRRKDYPRGGPALRGGHRPRRARGPRLSEPRRRARRAGQRAARPRHLGKADRASRPIAPTSRSIGSRRWRSGPARRSASRSCAGG